MTFSKRTCRHTICRLRIKCRIACSIHEASREIERKREQERERLSLIRTYASVLKPGYHFYAMATELFTIFPNLLVCIRRVLYSVLYTCALATHDEHDQSPHRLSATQTLTPEVEKCVVLRKDYV